MTKKHGTQATQDNDDGAPVVDAQGSGPENAFTFSLEYWQDPMIWDSSYLTR